MKDIKANLSIVIQPALIISTVLLLFFLADTYWGAHISFIPAIPLLLFLPGYNILRINPNLAERYGNLGKFALSVFISISVFAVFEFFTSLTKIDRFSVLLESILLNLLIEILAIIIRKKGVKLKIPNKVGILNTITDAWPIIIFIVFICVTIIINPMAQDADGFLTIINRSVIDGNAFTTFRQLFVWYIAFSSKLLNIPPIIIFRLLPPLLYVISSLFLFDLSKSSIKSHYLASLAFLSILIAPVLVVEANIIRSQVIMVILTLPSLIIAQKSIDEKNLSDTFLAIIFAFVATLFHELGFILLLVTVVALIYNILYLVIIKKNKLLLKKLLLFLAVAAPYFFLLKLDRFFTRISQVIIYAQSEFSGIHWKWWFIDNYVAVDGHSIGWPGVSALYYYLFNGMQLLLVLVMLIIILLIRRGNRIILKIIIPCLYFLIFFTIAEILPRLGYFFLPNRAWPHLITSLVVILVIIMPTIEQVFIRKYLIAIVLSLLTIIGAVGALYVSQNNVSQVYREESPSIKFIQKTPVDSIFISTQENGTIIEMYGKRKYIQMKQNGVVNRVDFEKQIEAVLHQASLKVEIQKTPDEVEHIILYRDGIKVSDIERVKSKKSLEIIPPFYTYKEPVYFYYSLRKSIGLNTAREYLKANFDLLNKDKYINLGYDTAYQDGSVIILRLR